MQRTCEQSPITYAAKIRTPTLMLTNTGDYRVPPTQSFKLYRALKDNGVHDEVHRLSDLRAQRERPGAGARRSAAVDRLDRGALQRGDDEQPLKEKEGKRAGPPSGSIARLRGCDAQS